MPAKLTAVAARKLIKQAGILSWEDLPKPRKRRAAKADATAAQALFLAQCAAHGLPVPVPEYQFAPPRKWRFDWAWMEGGAVALEIQGGLFVGGRHVRGAALLKEYEKLNEAAIRGWRMLFATSDDVKSGAVFALLKRALA